MRAGEARGGGGGSAAHPNVDLLRHADTPALRKRSREDDNCDFMPLSKRINNLHINNGASSIVHHSQSITQPAYDPGISPAQSSYYFENKLLYELYLERLRRQEQQPHY
ncbi:uncharacterized protein LOC143920869 [Arctopsyche grandis]|uniref:uncharacterized protein LOC143920869 n=1 Tax=Arctopsyche grandis TaxID=121162 RepID=UPI00406D6DC0